MDIIGHKNIKVNKNTEVEYNPPIWNQNCIIPNEYDWRDKNAVSSVKNQEQCGSCWAFSSVEAVEGAWAIQTKLLFNLSEQELVDCSFYLGNEGCMGGYMTQGFQYVMDNIIMFKWVYHMLHQGQNYQNTTCMVVRVSIIVWLNLVAKMY